MNARSAELDRTTTICYIIKMLASKPNAGQIKAALKATFNAAAEHFDDVPLLFWDHFGRRTVGILPHVA